jgi:phage shock protein A
MGRIWTKIATALRGGASESADAVVTPHALRILDQEIREADENLGIARSSLATLMAKSVLAARDLDRTEAQLATLTQNAEMALAAGREDLALEAAEQIGRLERLRVDDARVAQQYSNSVEGLRSALQNSKDKLAELRAQVEMVRVTEIMHQARASFSAPGGDSTTRLRSAADCLDEIRQRQREAAARLHAQHELMAGDAGLKQRLRAAGITVDSFDARSVLDRIKAALLDTHDRG